MGIAPVEQFQNERGIVDTSSEGTDVESGTLIGNPPRLFNRTHGQIFKQDSQTFISRTTGSVTSGSTSQQNYFVPCADRRALGADRRPSFVFGAGSHRHVGERA